MSYIAFGYIYLLAYHWISFKDSKDFQNIVFKSIVANYILTTCYQMICMKLNINFSNVHYQIVVYITVSGLLGLTCGKIITSCYFNEILHKLYIGRTTNNNIWDDIVKPYTWLCVYMKDGTSYLGQYRYGESFQREPIIVLTTYQKYNAEDDIVLDYSQDNTRAIVLNTKDFEKIEVVYTK